MAAHRSHTRRFGAILAFVIALGAPISALPAAALTAKSVGSTVAATPAPRPKNLEVTGRALVTKFLTILQRGDSKALARFLDPAFLIQRADGSGADKPEYLANPAVVTSFVIPPGLEVRQHGDVITVRWSLEVDETIDGAAAGTGQAPRLSTFHWSGSQWQLLSHANFNLPS